MDRGSFEALYHAKRLHVVNPKGDVGLVCLWSPLGAVKKRLLEISPELLDERRSRLAVISNLYGDGMYAMWCNLLFNPQVRHLIALGQDLGLPTCAEIEAFLERGLEDAELLGRPVKRVPGTARLFPAIAEFDEARLRERLSFAYLGKLSTRELPSRLLGRLEELPREDPGGRVSSRLRVNLDEGRASARRRPSEPGAHQVVRRRPLDCWRELVVRTMRFGRPVSLRRGARLELLNAKAVILRPARESRGELEHYGFDLDSLVEYEAKMLSAELPEETAYTYGNRLRAHFRGAAGPLDTIEEAIGRLRSNPRTRHAYVALWDNRLDLAGERNVSPCLTTLFFRKSGEALSLTATYRAHNLLTAWLRNVYGLMAIQRHVAGACAMEAGELTVISHSLGLDPASPRLELARGVVEEWRRDEDRDPETGKYSLREDPHGYFVVDVDEAAGRIVAEHRFEGVLVKRYEAARADAIAGEVAADMAVSLASHGLWLGRELARAEARLDGFGRDRDGS